MTDNYLKSRLELFFALSLFPHQNLEAVRFVLFIKSLFLWEQNYLRVSFAKQGAFATATCSSGQLC